MNTICTILLAVLSIWDYPARQPAHETLKTQFVFALKNGETKKRIDICRQAVAVFPEDPTWRYNLACSLAYMKDKTAAFDELEQAIDLGFRDRNAIANDPDFKSIAKMRRFKELLDYADEQKGSPLFTGPLAYMNASGYAGEKILLSSPNLSWNFDWGCFDVHLQLIGGGDNGNSSDIYFNRDGGHSMVAVTNFPGLTAVGLDQEGAARGANLDIPNMRFDYPVFGNCSRALTVGPMWRSLPRMLTTGEARKLVLMEKFYLTNQIWAFPVVNDYGPLGTNGDVFASVTPYWIPVVGKSWSDLPFVNAALRTSAALKQAGVKNEIVRAGMLGPVMQWLLRTSIKGVDGDTYLTAKAHPTAFAAKEMDFSRMVAKAKSLTKEAIPPVAIIKNVESGKPLVGDGRKRSELTYATHFAWAFILRDKEPRRSFKVTASGGDELAFAIVHDERGAAKLSRTSFDEATVEIDKALMSPTNRIDLAVFARKRNGEFGAPSFVCFGTLDGEAPYIDPMLKEQE